MYFLIKRILYLNNRERKKNKIDLKIADKYLRLFQTQKDGLTKQCNYKLIAARDIGWSILDTAFSPDGQYIVYSSWSESSKII